MNKLLVFIVAAILMFTAVFFIPAGADNVTSSSFGEWRVSAVLETADGEQVDLKPMDSVGAMLLNFYHDGSQVSTVTYSLEAKAAGEGYTHARIFKDSIESDGLLDGPDVLSFGTELGSGYVDVPLNDGEFHTVCSRTFDFSTFDEVADGTYTLGLCYSGGVEYCGVTSGGTTDPTQTTTLDQYVEQEVTYEAAVITCLQCDGTGGVDSMETTDSSCPDGWTEASEFDEDCDCYVDQTLGSWSSWSNMGCVGDCYMRQKRSRDVLEATICPGFVGPPSYQKVGTLYDYRNVYDSSCCEPDEITCYQCDGSGGVNSKTVDGTSCPSGWSSSRPDCSCDTDTVYGSWSAWEFAYCIGYTKYERRTRDVYTVEYCPGFVGPPAQQFDHTETEWRNSFDTNTCGGGFTFNTGTYYSVQSTEYVDTYEYEGRTLG